MNDYKYYLIVLFLGIFISCKEKGEIKVINFSDLPVNVKDIFIERYNHITVNNTPPFSECVDLNIKCDCKTTLNKNYVFSGNTIKISSCNKSFFIPMDYLQRVYVIDKDTVYIPYTFYGTIRSINDARSKRLKIDTIKFIKVFGKERIPFLDKKGNGSD